MNKKIAVFLSILVISLPAFSDVRILFEAWSFLDKDGDALQSGKAVFLVDATGGNFENFSILAGDSLSNGGYLNASNDYFVLSSGIISFDGTDSGTSAVFEAASLDSSLVGKNIGLLFLDVPSDADNYDIMQTDTYYGFFTPQMAVDAGVDPLESLSAGDDWVTVASGLQNIFALSQSYGFSIPDSMFMASSVIPEPATYAALLGAAALGIVVLRRRGGKL